MPVLHTSTGATLILDPGASLRSIAVQPIQVLRGPDIERDTRERLQQHKSVLESCGIDDLSSLGTLQIAGPVVPQIGLLQPMAEIYEAQTTIFERASILDPASGQVQPVGGTARLLKASPFPRRLRPLPTPIHMPRAGAVLYRDDAYWAATRIELAEDTLVILRYPNQFLTVICEELVVGRNVTFTWDKPGPESDSKKPDPADNGQDRETSTELWGLDGGPGAPGAPGNKGADAKNAPELELWMLALTGRPIFIFDGQDGFPGGDGGDGGRGGNGSPGRNAIYSFIGPFVNCQSGPGSGGNGGNGGAAGNGGPGGNGGTGGRVTLCAPQAVLAAYAQGFYIDVGGGAPGPGGIPGVPGHGGQGGPVGQNPHGCRSSEVRTAGAIGRQGAPGEQGPAGMAGTKLTEDPTSFRAIDADEFRRKLLAPVLAGLTPKDTHAGDEIKASGRRFTATDIILVDGEACATKVTSDTALAFTLPAAVAGGQRRVQLRQEDGTLSNPESLLVRPKLAESPAGKRLRPGARVVLTGSGFAPGCRVQLNGQDMPEVELISATAIRFTLRRPTGLARNPNGEPVSVRVALATGELSNALELELDTYRILAFGDSVMWGQGLLNSHKLHQLVADHIREREGGISVFVDNFAHSGAPIGISDDGDEDQTQAPRLDGEVPTNYPTILQQVAEFGEPTGSIDLILLNGGINDVNVRRILPSTDDATLDELTALHCHRHMEILLKRVVAKFPVARIVVLGYFPIVSKNSDLTALTALLIGLGLSLGAVLGALGAAVVSDVVRSHIARNCRRFYERSTIALQAAVDEVNAALINERLEPTGRVVLAAPEFDDEHAALGPRPWLFGINLDLSPQDSEVAVPRGVACEAAAGRTDVQICRRASIGHPNAAGAEAYAREIAQALCTPHFPPDFLWGAATAGYQVEGGIENNDWHVFTTSPAIHDRVADLSQLVGLNYDLRPPGEAVRHQDLAVLAADLDRAQAIGLNAYRFSLEWSRIQPTAAAFDPAALDYYDRALELMLARGLRPIVTLNHLTLPQWVLTPPRETSALSAFNVGTAAEDAAFRGSLRGWESDATVEAFITYVRLVAARYQLRVDLWVTLNEPVGSMIGVGYLGGIWPPGFSLDGPRAKTAYFNLLRAHVRAYDAIKSIYGDRPCLVGIAHHMMHARLTRAGGGLGDINVAAQNQFDYFYNQHLLDALTREVVDTAIQHRPQDRANLDSRQFYGLSTFQPWRPRLDFIGINYYRAVYVSHDPILAVTVGYAGGAFDNDLSDQADHYLLSDLGWEIYPRGLYRLLIATHQTYHLPLLITENGMAEMEDRNRAPYILGHLQQILRAREEGAAVFGYMHWSIVDNFEWQEHYQPLARFGLFTIDRSARDANDVATLPRHITEAALALQYVIADQQLAGAIERFGSVSASGLAVSPPARSPGVLWQGRFADGTALMLYLSALGGAGSWLGMIFLAASQTWHRLEEVGSDGKRLRFAHRRPDRTLASYDAVVTQDKLAGTVTTPQGPASWEAQRVALFGTWRSSVGFPVHLHLRALEGDFDGWRGKFLRHHPDIAWVSCQTVVLNGATLSFDIGHFGDFQGSLTPDGVIAGTIDLIGGGGGATVPWQAKRLSDGVNLQ